MKELTITQRADLITSVPLLNREVHGEYVVWTVLSSNGVDEYRTTLHNGKCIGCTCPATIRECKHALACEFEEAWIAPIIREDELAEAAAVTTAVLGEFAQDVEQHVQDSIESGEFVDPFAGMTKAQQREAYRAMYPDDYGYYADVA